MVNSTPAFHYRIDAYNEAHPVGDSLEQALSYALDSLRFRHSGTLITHGANTQSGNAGTALFIALNPGTVLVVGLSRLARAIRELLAAPEGFDGWLLHALPSSRTPLHLLKSHMPTQQYNVLVRREFVSLEEIDSVPQDVWEELDGVGPKFVEALNAALNSTRSHLQGLAESSIARDSPQADYPHPERMDDQGWKLQVASDGRSATVFAPEPIAVTALVGTELRLAFPGGMDDAAAVPAVPPLEWTVDLAEQILRRAQPSASAMLRALIAEGGTATPARLRERTGLEGLHHARQSLTSAAAYILAKHHPNGQRYRHIFVARTDPDNLRSRSVYDYYLGDDLLSVFDEALTRLGR